MLNKPLTLLLFLCSFSLLAQSIEKDYYMFPVRPNEVNYLSGTMGELRSTHFHTGLDIKTSGITGLPIYAAADGYIMRAKISLGGYGNALYMVHPNGTITVYAHLKEFQKEIADFVRTEQYKKESFAIDLTIPKGKFSFKKGEVIALSGNSGSSSGPHLHFEIRDLNHKVLNPLSYGFKEIVDNVAPVLSKIAFVTMDEYSRVNGVHGRFEYNVIELDGEMVLEKPITLFGNIGVEVYAYDKFDGAKNKNGILLQTLMFDYEPVFSQNINEIEFSKQRNILVHTNYKRSKEGGRRFNKYYVTDGNLLQYYNTNNTGGIISILDPLEHSIDIQLEDSYHNVVQYHFPLNDAGYSKELSDKNMYFLNSRGYDVNENMLEMMSDGIEGNCFTRIFVKGKESLHTHAYTAESRHFYLWNLDVGIPDSADVCGDELIFNFKKTIPSEQKITYSNESLSLSFPKYALFDTLYLQYQKLIDISKQIEYFDFPHVTTPLRQSASITFKPELDYNHEKSAVYAVGSKGKLTFVGGEWKENTITLKAKALIKYTISSDTIPPKITKLKSAKSVLRFKIKDDKSGIHSYRAKLDSKWLLMRFDAKRGVITSDEKVKLSGKFTLVVKDNAKNYARYETNF